MSQPSCAEAASGPITFPSYSYQSPVTSPSSSKGHLRKRSSGNYSINTSPLQRLRQSTIANLPSNLENATAVLSRPAGRGIFSKVYLLSATVVIFFVVGLSIATDPNYYLSSAYKQQLVQELGRLPDSVRSLRLPDNVKSYLVKSDPSMCAAAARDAVEANTRILPKALVNPDLPPLAAGFGAISSAKNPTRNRFLVPIYACDEQETGAQMHIRQVLHLSKALNRTAILPNFGGMQIPTLSNCQPYAFDDIYDLDQVNAVELWSASYPTFERYINRTMNGREGSVSAQLSVVFSREAFKQIWHLDNSDTDILRESCVDPDPFDLSSPTLYVATEPQEPIERVVAGLKSAEDKDVLFVYFNHKSQFSSPQIVDPLLVDRPEFGLWSHAPFPYWNYSSTVDDIYHYALNQMPEDYVAIQWRLERVPPAALEKCSNMFIDEVIAGARTRQVSTVYIASDAPVRPGEGFKSASWDSAYQEGVQNAMANLVNALEAANLKVVTWKDVGPPSDSTLALSSIAENASGIFDRLMVGKSASWVFAPNTNCGMKSAYLGSIQTLRQDRIGDPTETDWEKLAMTWIGAPIEGKFWWNVDPEWEDWDKANL